MSHQLILMKICQTVYGYVLRRLVKFQQHLWVGNYFTLSQSFGMKIPYGPESTYGITHYVRSIPITLSVSGRYNCVI